MIKKFRILIILVAVFCSLTAQAVRQYSCDFENAEDRARWVLTPTSSPQIASQILNKWYIGEEGNNTLGGHYGLYISADEGASSDYTNRSCWSMAYDTVSLDQLLTANYQISFDYRAMGNVSDTDGIFAFWIPMVDQLGDSIKVMSIPTSDHKLPSEYKDYALMLQPNSQMPYVNGTSTWQQCVVSLKGKLCDGKPHYLVFAWRNGSMDAKQPGGMIDNIEISDERPCPAPTKLNVNVENGHCDLTWTGTADAYEVTAYSYLTNQWFGPVEVTNTSYSFGGLPASQTDFIVRSKCDEGLYSIKTMTTTLVYNPDELCVDYLNLKNAKCYTGTGFSSTASFNNYVLGAPVDHGPGMPESRHTVHFDQREKDQRTGNMLSTIPDGELASVRLGNWMNNNETERIEYSFAVDTLNYPVLLLKYAPILEAPSHSDTQNPRFKMDILLNGKPLDRVECTSADFNANDVLENKKLTPEAIAQGWHLTPDAEAHANGADVIWKDWTTVGVNLKASDVQGKKLTVRLTTFDCAMVQHCGYAYFTLGCSDGQLKGMKCAEINPVFEAPDGFVYRWILADSAAVYRKDDGSIDEKYVLGREQKYDAGFHDDNLYIVDCMFVQDTTCYFSLYASTLATNPVSVGTNKVVDMDCDNNSYQVSFDASKSYIQEIDHVTGDTIVSTRHKIQFFEWDFGDGQKSYEPIINHSFFADETKDSTYTVTLTTRYLTCEETQTITFTLSPIEHYTDSTIAYLCDADKASGKGYTWRGKNYKDYVELDSVVIVSTTACDTIHYFSLREPHRDTVTTMIFDYETYNFHGTSYNKAGVYHYVSGDCDTADVLNLSIYETLKAELLTTNYIACQGDPSIAMDVQITRGKSRLFSNVFEDSTLIAPIHREDIPYVGLTPNIVIPIPTDLYPNIYKAVLTLHDTLPEQDVNMPYTLEMRYPATVLAQRWNDVLAVKNAEYNDINNPGDGFDFRDFQWYKNGEPIPGATLSFLFIDGGLDFSATYSAEITRADGQKLMTCNFTPTKVEQVSPIPSLLPIGTNVTVQGKGKARWFSPLGLSVSEQDYNNSTITTPNAVGTYLLQLAPDENQTAPHTYRVVIY